MGENVHLLFTLMMHVYAFVITWLADFESLKVQMNGPETMVAYLYI